MNLLDRLIEVSRHLPPSHTIENPGQITGVLSALVHTIEDDGFLKSLDDAEGSVEQAVAKYFNDRAESENQQYLKDHPEAAGHTGNQAQEISELRARLAALEASQGQNTTSEAPAGPGAVTSPAVESAPGTVAEPDPATVSPSAPPAATSGQADVPAPADPAQPTYAELVQQLQSAQAQLGAQEAEQNPPTAVEGQTPPAEAPPAS